MNNRSNTQLNVRQSFFGKEFILFWKEKYFVDNVNMPQHFWMLLSVG
jgi:hypothetical protein